METPKMTLYVDVVSPFAYIAYYLLRHSPAFKQVQITYTPVLLGGIMQATGNTPPISIKNKAPWINKERERWAAAFSIPVADGAPDGFPISTVHAGRALCVLQSDQAKLTQVLDRLFHEVWGPPRNERQANDPKGGLPQVLAEVLGESEAKGVMERIGSEEVKKALSGNTSEALEGGGAFGLPWFVATNAEGKTEGFWGVDHLGQVCEHLGLDKNQLGRGGRSLL